MSEQNIKLANCPFCGGEAELFDPNPESKGGQHVGMPKPLLPVCKKCEVIFDFEYKSQHKVFFRFNTRASTAERDKAIARAVWKVAQHRMAWMAIGTSEEAPIDLDDYLNSEEFKKLVGEK
jgi:hypothetical protein